MKKKRTIHEVAFRLSYDLKLQIMPHLGKLEFKPAPLQLRAMRQIWSSDETTLLDISKTLKKDKSQVKRLIDELCSSGLVYREPHPKDKRSKILKLTDKGNEFFTLIESIEAKFSKQLISGIPKEELDTFFKVSDQLSKNLQQIEK